MFSFTNNHITYQLEIPAYPVNMFIDHFVIMKGQGQKVAERLFPNNKAEIFFNLGDPVKGQNNLAVSAPAVKENMVSGIRNSFFDFYPPRNFYMAGMRFTLFGFNHLFKIPAYHFTDNNIPASDVFDRSIGFLQERLHEARNTKEIFTILNNWVMDRLLNCSLQECTVWNKLESKLYDPALSIPELLNSHMGYSQKHAIQLFKNHSGLRPKDIRKIIRFNQTLKNMARMPIQSGSGFAYDAGYSDQSHFIREFRYFTGYTPLEYLSTKPHEYYFFENLPAE